jgi:hypothetical protein
MSCLPVPLIHSKKWNWKINHYELGVLVHYWILGGKKFNEFEVWKTAEGFDTKYIYKGLICHIVKFSSFLGRKTFKQDV